MNPKPNTIYRSERGQPYKAISRTAMEDSRLSFEARGCLAYLLVKPDDWVVRVADLRRAGNIGRDKTYSILTELMDAGYLERTEHRTVSGKIAGYSYAIHEQPYTPSPLPAQPLPAQPLPANTDITNKEVVSNKEVVTKEEADDGEPSSTQRVLFATISEVCGYNAKTMSKRYSAQVGIAASALHKAGYDRGNVLDWFENVWKKQWPGNKGDRPRPDQVTALIGSAPVSIATSKLDKTFQNLAAAAGRMRHDNDSGRPSQTVRRLPPGGSAGSHGSGLLGSPIGD